MDSRYTPPRSSRRRVLAGVTAVATIGVAGCLSDDDETDGTGNGGDDDRAETEDGTADDEGDEPGSNEAQLSPPVKGDPDAPVTVEVYEDFGCGGCRFYHENVLPEVQEEFLDDGQIRYEHRDLPLPASALSWEAANAARAVQDRAGDETFWEYASKVYDNQGSLTVDLLGTLAEDVGVDGDAVRTAASEQEYDETVSADRQRAIDSGVDATPTVVVDGEAISWQSISYPPVQEAIAAALE